MMKQMGHMTSRKRFTSLVLGILLIAPGTTRAQEDRSGAPLGQRLPTPANAAGLPVRSEQGVPLNHGPEEMRAAARNKPARAVDAGTGAAAFSSSTAPSGKPARWSFATFGSGIGLTGIVTARNGRRNEIYFGGSMETFGSNTVWYALAYSRGTYEQVFVSEYLPAGIVRILLATTEAGMPPRIVVALKDGTIRVYDQRTKSLLSTSIDFCSHPIYRGLAAFATADLDGNGSDEYISSCGDKNLVVSGTGYTQWSVAGVGGQEIVVGQMDDDPALEVATTDGYNGYGGYVIDTESRAVQWERPGGRNEAHLEAADIDSDGRDELIVADEWYHVRAYDVETQAVKWDIRADLDVDAISVTDIDNDGVQELLLGDGQWGKIHSYDTVTQQYEWAITNPEHGVTNIAVADLNNDGASELVWASGATSTGADYLYVANWQTRTILWHNEHLDGPFIGPEVGDLDGDGQDEIVVASFSSDAGYKGGRIVVIDANTRRLRAISPDISSGSRSYLGVQDLKLRDLNGDGRLEILIANDNFYNGYIAGYSFSALNEFKQVWYNATPPVGAFYSIDAADVDRDGDMEVIGGSRSMQDGVIGPSIYVYDVATHAEQWHTPPAGDGRYSFVADLAIADTDADGSIEIAAMVGGGNVYVFDGATRALEAVIDTQGASLTTRDLGAGAQLLLADTDGRISLRGFDGVGYPEVEGANLGSAAPEGLTVPRGALWVGSGGILQRFWALREDAETFESLNYGAGFGSNVATLPGRRWVFSAGGYGVHGFVVSP